MDEVAVALVVEILSDPRNADAIGAAAREAAQLDLAITEAKDAAEVVADRVERGGLPLSRYYVAVRPLHERITKLEAERAALSDAMPEQSPAQEANREQWRKRWEDADHKEKRDLLKVALRGEHLVVTPAEHGLGSYDLAKIMPRVSIG